MVVGINLIAEYSVNGAGTFTYIKNLLQQMENYDLSGVCFVLYKQKQLPQEHLGIPDNIDVEYINVPNLGGGIRRIVFEQTLFYLYLRKCDVFYSYCSSMPLFVRARRFFTLHDVYFLTFKRRYSWIKRKYLDFITSLYIRQSTAVITVSNYSKEQICAHYNVASEKLVVTYNFVRPHNVPTSNVVRTNILQDLFDVNQRYALYVGSIQPGKNIEGMVAGFNLFRERHPDYNLVIVGKPLYKAEKILDLATRSENVFYLGYQPDEIVGMLYEKCQFTVLLSFCEGFGIPPIEGFSYGKVALVSDTSSLPEVVGEAGCKVSPYDINAIANGFCKLAENSQKYTKQINSQLEKFDASVSVEAFMSTLSIPFRKR